MNKFIIVVDTSEQTPWFAGRNAPKGIMIMRDNLKDYGSDYSIKGFEKLIGVERKNPDDFISSITSGKERFQNSLKKLADIPNRCIVVECELSKILKKCVGRKNYKKRGKLSPRGSDRFVDKASVLGFLTSAQAKYNIPVYFRVNKSDAEDFVLGIFQKFYKMKRDK